MAEEGKPASAAPDELLCLAEDGYGLYVVGASSAYPGDGLSLLKAASQGGWGVWGATEDEFELLMMTAGEQRALQLDYRLENGRLRMNLGEGGRMSTLERIDTSPATLTFRDALKTVEMKSGFSFLTLDGWGTQDPELREGVDYAVSLHVSGDNEQRMAFARLVDDQDNLRRATLEFSSGVMRAISGAEPVLRVQDDRVGCGVQGEMAFAAQIPGYARAESVWVIRSGEALGVVCMVPNSSPDHFELIPIFAGSAQFEGEPLFVDSNKDDSASGS